MKNRNTLPDLVLKWTTRAVFAWLALWGFMLYTQMEWMMDR